jgi:hypothetical protein
VSQYRFLGGGNLCQRCSRAPKTFLPIVILLQPGRVSVSLFIPGPSWPRVGRAYYLREIQRIIADCVEDKILQPVDNAKQFLSQRGHCNNAGKDMVRGAPRRICWSLNRYNKVGRAVGAFGEGSGSKRDMWVGGVKYGRSEQDVATPSGLVSCLASDAANNSPNLGLRFSSLASHVQKPHPRQPHL